MKSIRLMFLSALLILLALLVGCDVNLEENTPPSSEENEEITPTPHFIGIKSNEFIVFEYNDGKFTEKKSITFDEMSYAGDVVSDGKVAVAWRYGGFEVVDVTDWLATSRYYKPEKGIDALGVKGEYIFTIERDTGFHIYKRGAFSVSETGNIQYYGDDLIEGDYIYVIDDSHVGLFDGNTYYLVDVSDKAHPKIVAKIDLGTDIDFYADKILTVGTKLYLSGWSSKVYEISFDDPSSPTVVTYELNGSASQHPFVYNNLILDYYGRIYDLTTGEKIADIEVTGYPIAYDNKAFYFKSDKVKVFDISDPYHPVFVKSYSIDKTPEHFTNVYEYY